MVNPKNIDPKLKLAREEIDQILQKYDLTALIALGSKTHNELFMHEATWFTGKFENGGLIISTTGKSREDRDATLSLVLDLSDVVSHWAIGLLECAKFIGTKIDIKHLPFGGPGGFSDDE
jgi:hypothetical protein